MPSKSGTLPFKSLKLKRGNSYLWVGTIEKPTYKRSLKKGKTKNFPVLKTKKGNGKESTSFSSPLTKNQEKRNKTNTLPTPYQLHTKSTPAHYLFSKIHFLPDALKIFSTVKDQSRRYIFFR
jgi:hypothetical protein